MKRSILFILLIFNTLYADALPNTGLAQNQYGYYGEGVTLGGYPIVGDWRLCSDTPTTLDNNGSVNATGIEQALYGVSEDGKNLIINGGYFLTSYTLDQNGNEGCFIVDYYFTLTDVSVESRKSCIICKATIGSKTYGSPSDSVSITVGEN